MSLNLFNPCRSTTIDGLPSPVSTPRHSNGVHHPTLLSPVPPTLSSAPDLTSTPSLAPTTNLSSRTHHTAYIVPPTTDTGAQDEFLQPQSPLGRVTDDSVIPISSGVAQPAVTSQSSPLPISRTSRSTPPNSDSQRLLCESPTSNAIGNANDYAEGLRLFPPSPASSIPQPRSFDIQPPDQDQEQEPLRDPDAQVWNRERWFPDKGQHRSETLKKNNGSELLSQIDNDARLRDSAQWPDSWRGGNEQPWANSTPAEVRVSGSTRAQQPTVVAPPPAPAQQPQVEEVCVECAMRDQDMADVDVTGPGVWARKSDAAYEEQLRRELDEEMSGFSPAADSGLSHVRGGGKLTETNLKLWLTMVSISISIFP